MRIAPLLPIDFKRISINLRRQRRRDHAPHTSAVFLHRQRLSRPFEMEQNFSRRGIEITEGDPPVGMYFAGIKGRALLTERAHRHYQRHNKKSKSKQAVSQKKEVTRFHGGQSTGSGLAPSPPPFSGSLGTAAFGGSHAVWFACP